MKLVVGLGNPGKEYENTRHNVGFIIIDNYLKGTTWNKDKDCMYQIVNYNGERIIFLKPLTYMNLSGIAVVRIANYYKIDPKDILIVHDDLDLKTGIYRLKTKSSSGGHNGIKNIIQLLGTNEFSHLKVGIGNNKDIDTRNYVLNKLSTEEINDLQSDKYIEIINYFLDNGIEKAMNRYNSNEV
ncbi:MAG: aminoacyl-tRNA hydrolase [Firmicutes bacterium]|nr:aminoacyl-tRNA hydrolase [Bacillota bacterium]